MLINDYSQQDWTTDSSSQKITISEVLTAGIIFIVPVIFLLVLSVK